MTISDSAFRFFDACETGKGWNGCATWCKPDATFTAQADSLKDVTTLSAYCDWMRDLLVPVPNGRYALKAMAVDDERKVALAFAEFHGTHTVDGPVPATGKNVVADYVYSMEFDNDGQIKHMTKIWNDGHSLKQLGWA